MKKVKMIQMGFKIPEPLHRSLKDFANTHGMKIQYIATQALVEKIEKEK